MKTTLELPDELMRQLKVRAAVSDRKLKDTVEELIRRGLEQTTADSQASRLEKLRNHLRFHPDGSITNPEGIDDQAFFQDLETMRAASRNEIPHDPFA